MPPRPHENDWILVQSRKSSRRGRVFDRDRSTFVRHPEGRPRRSYAEAVREDPLLREPSLPSCFGAQHVRHRSIPPASDHWHVYPDGEERPRAQRPQRYATPANQYGSHWITTRGDAAGAPPHRVQSDDPDFTQKLSTGGWRGPFEIATCWARRHLGTRLKQETLDRCHRMLNTRLREPVPPSPPPSVSEHIEELEEDLSLELTPSPSPAVQPQTPRPQSPAGARKRAPKKTKRKSTERDWSPLLELTEMGDTECSSPAASPPPPHHHSPMTPPPTRRKIIPAAKSFLIPELQPVDAQRASQEQSTEAPHPTPAGPAAFSAAAVQVCTPTQHLITPRKFRDWHLHIHQETVIVGDSNVGRLPSFKADHIQVDSFPQATWQDAEFLLKNATCHTQPKTILLSFGIHQRTHKDKDIPVIEMFHTFEVAEQLFPEANIVVPMIGYSHRLPPQEKAVLDHLNEHIGELCNHICLSDDPVETDQDNVNWTADTAMRMLKYWSPRFLPLGPTEGVNE
ncbi:uncharacterized protein LOC144981779 isoform X1 [Oryzias latipes]